MHVIALDFAHFDGNPGPQIAALLFESSFREVLHRAVGRVPIGIKRVLRRLPPKVLSRPGYLRLIKLLNDPDMAKVLHHFDETEISDSMIQVLYEIPVELRPALAELARFIESFERLDHLPNGLRWLTYRGAAESFEALVTDLSAHVQPAQFVARLKTLVIAAAANLAASADWKCATDGCHSGHLRAGQGIQELPCDLPEAGRCGSMRDLCVGQSGCTGSVPDNTPWPSGLVPQRCGGLRCGRPAPERLCANAEL